MNLKNGTELFRELARAPDLEYLLQSRNARVSILHCDEHADTEHYIDGAAINVVICVTCVNMSRALSITGRAGGRKGGKALTPRKLAQLKAASEAARQARQRRAARNEKDKTGDGL